ncbi:MAG: hypothetical protein IT186_26730 [Acidobacteria bacterium]|nr:hypothetical protein [Acidobacteriota bacterium]
MTPIDSNSAAAETTDQRVTITLDEAIAHARTASVWMLVAAFIPSSGALWGLLDLVQGSRDAFTLVFTSTALLLGSLYVSLGLAVRRRHVRARMPAMILAAVSLLLIPVGTIFGFLILTHLGTAIEGGAFGPASTNDTARTPQTRA